MHKPRDMPDWPPDWPALWFFTHKRGLMILWYAGACCHGCLAALGVGSGSLDTWPHELWGCLRRGRAAACTMRVKAGCGSASVVQMVGVTVLMRWEADVALDGSRGG